MIFKALLIPLLSFSVIEKDFDIKLISGQLQVELDNLIKEISVPGANLSVIMPDGNNISLSSGYSDLENQTPMNSNNMMLSGSIGKTYVAAIAFKLIEEKKLNLSDKVVTILKDVEWIDKVPSINDLTVDMLLTHTSGLPRYEYFDDVWKSIKSDPDKIWSVYDRIKYIFDEKPLHSAGNGWYYSDSNFILLGLVLEKASGREYYDLFKSMISKLTVLKNTLPSDTRKIKNLSSGYTGFLSKYGYPEKVSENEVMAFNPQMEWCGGGVVSTTTDIALWAKLLYEGKVVSNQSVRRMVTPSRFQTDLTDNAKYGYGTIIWKNGFKDYYGHQGFFPGYRSIVEYSPDYGFSIALQINKDNPATNLTLNQMLQPFIELIVSNLNDKSN
ncbi:MAG: serine hydrolase domain-containing protein [Tenuifilaceae bacterium]